MRQALGYLMLFAAVVGWSLYCKRHYGLPFRQMLTATAFLAGAAVYLTIAALLIVWPSPGG